MRRREFITLLGGAAAAASVSWPYTASAQRADKPHTIGFMSASALAAMGTSVEAFVQRLRELGWIQGSNVVIEYRSGEGVFERLAGFAADFVRQGVDIIVAERHRRGYSGQTGDSRDPDCIPDRGGPRWQQAGRQSLSTGRRRNRAVNTTDRTCIQTP